MAKREKATRFSIQTYDNAHYKTTNDYVRVVDKLFDTATKSIAQAAAKGDVDPDKPFSFDDYPKVKKVMQKAVQTLAGNITTAITDGSRSQWLFACEKNDAFVESIMDTSKLSKSMLSQMQDRNLDALGAFQERKVNGMDLSQRVWNYVDQYKGQIEDALDVGLGEGRSAQQLARDVKKNLNEPNRLFRRVRDKRGNLVLSKNARKYHPGQGVYRSSVKNAQRLTRSEINMAYRESDWQRWQQLDFVVGIEIKRSNHEPLCECDLCSKLTGRYPKAFKFVGWHPQCMCFAIPILMDDKSLKEHRHAVLRAALDGTDYQPRQAADSAIGMPKGFIDWVTENKGKQSSWSSTPYFIRDNFKNGKLSDGLKFKTNSKGLLISYTTAEEVNQTFKMINDALPADDKWFKHGDLDLRQGTKAGVNGNTNKKGIINLDKRIYNNVLSALGKIGAGNSRAILPKEADAMATLWHEITHNRVNTITQKHNDEQKSYMEMANEFVARHSLKELYQGLGVKKIPYPKLQTNRITTDYNYMVTNYDYVINKFHLNFGKVYSSVYNHLFNEPYSTQEKGLMKGLVDGGLKYANGKSVSSEDLKELVRLIKDAKDDESTSGLSILLTRQQKIDDWLASHGF